MSKLTKFCYVLLLSFYCISQMMEIQSFANMKDESNKSNNGDDLTISEQLAYSTVKIDVIKSDNKTYNGTGFFFNFKGDNNSIIPVIVTNKHVIRDSLKGSFYMNLADDNGKPVDKSFKKILVDNFEDQWIMHPINDIDLAVMPIGPLLNNAKENNFNLFYLGVDESLIASDVELKELGAVEDILMVGYPIGLWDEENNYPIFRTGTTATHPANDYNGKKEFLIDAACFPGSSGSPVFLYNIGSYSSKKGSTVIGSRFKFLGVLHAGPIYNPDGDIEVVDIPTTKVAIWEPNILINLGYVIKANQLLIFDKIIKDRIESSK